MYMDMRVCLADVAATYSMGMNAALRDVLLVMRRCMPPPRDPSTPRLEYWDVLRHVVHGKAQVEPQPQRVSWPTGRGAGDAR